MFVTPELISTLHDMRVKIDSVSGDGVSNHARNIVIAAQKPKAAPPVPQRREGYWAKIISFTRDGANWRWFYQVQESYKSAAGYGTAKWTVVPGSEQKPAFNATEQNNGASGALGNGVSVANLGTCVVKPCPVDTPVFVRFVPLADGTVELQFEYANGVDKS